VHLDFRFAVANQTYGIAAVVVGFII